MCHLGASYVMFLKKKEKKKEDSVTVSCRVTVTCAFIRCSYVAFFPSPDSHLVALFVSQLNSFRGFAKRHQNDVGFKPGEQPHLSAKAT